MNQSKRVMNLSLQSIIINEKLKGTFLEENISADDLNEKLHLEENMETIQNEPKNYIRGYFA